MNRITPARDHALVSGEGLTRDGQPIAYNRGPAPDLSPWIARLYVTNFVAPDDHVLDCGLLNDTSFLRVQLSGEWRAQTLAGPFDYGRSALFLGPHSRRMPIRVKGSFISVGMALRPGACHALKGPKVADHVDRIASFDAIGGSEERVLSLFQPGATAEEWIRALEDEFRLLLDRYGVREPDPVAVAFERIAFCDPTKSVASCADELCIDQRRLERMVRRDFGMPPKQVLRRARALDLASHLRGVADLAEAEELALRYYDQSHLIREFTQLFGMLPSQFVTTPQPLMTAALETRQARRLEVMDRLAPGSIKPWE